LRAYIIWAGRYGSTAGAFDVVLAPWVQRRTRVGGTRGESLMPIKTGYFVAGVAAFRQVRIR